MIVFGNIRWNNRLQRWGYAAFAALAVFGLCQSASSADKTDEKPTVGRVEEVWIKDADLVLEAKMDTGTLTSSLGARDIQTYIKDKDVWVRFTIRNTAGEPITLERMLVRFARFKKQGHDVERRPVVELGLCIGNIYHLTQVNLSDRNRFTYPLLIGRRFLTGRLIVDTEKIYVNPPTCPEMKKKK